MIFCVENGLLDFSDIEMFAAESIVGNEGWFVVDPGLSIDCIHVWLLKTWF